MGTEMMRVLGQAAESGVGFPARIMSKVDTDQGLGPGSERQRQELLKAKDEAPVSEAQKAAKEEENAERDAITQPGLGKAERRKESVDELLEGFGTSRPDLPRILPPAETTPPPDPVQKELTPTSPGERQRARNVVLAMVGSFLVIVVIGLAIVKLGATGKGVEAPTVKSTATPTLTIPTTPSTTLTDVPPVPTINTMQVDSLPTASQARSVTGRPLHTGGTSTNATTIAPTPTPPTATATARPTGSAPPGMNLLPDDPHR